MQAYHHTPTASLHYVVKYKSVKSINLVNEQEFGA